MGTENQNIDFSKLSDQELLALSNKVEHDKSVALQGEELKDPVKKAMFVGRSALEGHTAGISEPIVSAVKAAAFSTFGTKSFSEEFKKDVAQRKLEKESSPILDASSQVGGSLLPSPVNVMGKLVRGGSIISKIAGLGSSKLLPTLARGAVKGAVAAGGAQALKEASQRPTGFTDSGSPLENIATAATIGGVVGAPIEVAGNLAQIFGRKIVEKPNASEIRAAGNVIGAEPSPGQVMRGDVVSNLEYSLNEGPFIGGGQARAAVKKSFAGPKEIANDLLSDASNYTHSDVGAKVKPEIMTAIEERVAPISDIYNSLIEPMKATPARVSTIQNALTGLQQHALVDSSKELSGIISNNADALANIKDVNQLQVFTKGLATQLRNRSLSPMQKYGIDLLHDAAKEDIEKSLIQNAQSVGIDGKSVAEKLAEARKLYATTMHDFANSLNLSDKALKTPGAIKEAVSAIPDQSVGKKLFNIGNVRELEEFKQRFPEQFEQLRQSRIADIIKSSSSKGEINPSALIRNVHKLEPEANNLIFGSNSAEKIAAMEKFLDSIKGIKDPGTAKQIALRELFSPVKQAGSLLTGGLYDALTLPSRTDAIPNALQRVNATTAQPDNALTRRILKRKK